MCIKINKSINIDKSLILFYINYNKTGSLYVTLNIPIVKNIKVSFFFIIVVILLNFLTHKHCYFIYFYMIIF